jgi:formylglycine-generating enzyme required for sulfatase activity/tRNA A-37 threonylcarbamoyl transferase component Bud32
MPLTIDQILSQRYRILRPLGAGGMGAAYLVRDQRLNRNSVIKEVLTPDTTRRGLFEHEAQLLAGLRHPHLPVVYDYFQDGAHPYLVMEYVEGATLDRLRADRATPFEIHDVLKWARELLDALNYIHTHDPAIIHRDIKPPNVCIMPHGKAVLLDFGIARQLDNTHTQTGARAFTHNYAPIEQYPEEQLLNTQGPRHYVGDLHREGFHTGTYSDIYSLGATLYDALTLMPPTDACMRVLGDELPPVQQRNPSVPDFLAAAVMKALALHPRDRFQSAAEMLEALQPQPEPSPIFRRRRAPRPLPTSNIMALEQELLYIPAGPFWMGNNDADLKETCRPRHAVTLGAYCIGRFPVTNADYQHYIDANPDVPVPYNPLRFAQPYVWDRRTRTYPRGRDDHPVVLVTWEEARAYCRWLSEISGYRCRLPSEAEWEKAACWDPAAEVFRRYPWGDDFDDSLCNVDAHGALRLETTPVGRYSPAGDSPYGLVDMAGNVWEWTGSLYRPYPYQADDGREDPKTPGERVVRGGAFDEGPLAARCAWRDKIKPDLRLPNTGFRVACEAGDR